VNRQDAVLGELLARGASPNATDMFETSLLHFAALQGRVGPIAALIDAVRSPLPLSLALFLALSRSLALSLFSLSLFLALSLSLAHTHSLSLSLSRSLFLSLALYRSLSLSIYLSLARSHAHQPWGSRCRILRDGFLQGYLAHTNCPPLPRATTWP